MIAALVWKEYREHRNVWVALAGLAVLVVAGMFYLLDPPGLASSLGGKHAILMFAGFVVAGTYGVVCGAMMLADERDSGTLPFLDALTARRTPIWRTKLLLGLVFTLLQALFIATLVVPFLPRHAEEPYTTQVTILFAVTIAVALEAFVWGFFLSGFFKHALTAAGTAAVVVVVLHSVSLGMALVAIVAAFALRGFIVLVALWGSWRMFCREDLGREPRTVSVLRVVRGGFIGKQETGQHEIWRRMLLLIVIPVGLVMFIPDPTKVIAPFLLLLAAGTGGAGAGAMALGGKQPAAWPGLRGNLARVFALWLVSVCAGLLLAGLLVLLPLANSGHVVAWPHRGDIREPLMWTCIETFAAGLLLSTLLGKARSAFNATMILGSILAIVQVLWRTSPQQVQGFHEYGLFAAAIATLSSAFLLLLRYARSGARPRTWEVEEEVPPAPVQAPIRAAHATRLWPIVWLNLRQARVLAIVLAVAALGVGPAVRWYGVVVWPVFTLLVGILCGIGVYGEQSSGAHRFLGDQRLPPGRVWLVKIGVWLALAVLICALAFLPAAMIAEWQALDPGVRDSRDAGLEPYLGDSVLLAVSNRHLFLTLWLAYGFAVGQFFGPLCTKPPVAVVLSLVVAPVLSALWIPSLVGGGLHLWQVFLPPLVLVLATRICFWTWVAGALHRPRPILFQAGLGLVSVACLAGGLWYRVLEVPDLGEPFDVAEFEAGFPTPEQNRAGMLIRSVSRRFGERLEESKRRFPLGKQVAGPPNEGGAPDGAEAPNDESNRLQEVLEKGWGVADERLKNQMDYLFEGEWAARLKDLPALPLGVVVGPAIGYGQSSDAIIVILEDARNLTSWLCGRSRQLQAQGDHAAALDRLLETMALSRNLRNRATAISYLTGKAIESVALEQIEAWVENAQSAPGEMRRLLEELARHEVAVPTIVELEKVDYLETRSRLADMIQLVRKRGQAELVELDSQIVASAWLAPWERERRERLLNGFYHRRLPRAGLDLASAPDARFSDLSGAPPVDLGGAPWLEVYSRSFGVLTFDKDLRPIFAMGLAHIRGLRLKTALLLYQLERGKAADPLQQLIPAYIPAVPSDPFLAGTPFRYRVSAGENIGVRWSDPPPPSGETPGKFVPARWGIIWSAGRDFLDSGGRSNGKDVPQTFEEWRRRNADVIFLVPNWLKEKPNPSEPSEKGATP